MSTTLQPSTTLDDAIRDAVREALSELANPDLNRATAQTFSVVNIIERGKQQSERDKQFIATLNAYIPEIMATGFPSDAQLETINKRRPVGSEPYEAQDLYVFPMLSSHNVLSYNRTVWDVESLKTMTRESPGKVFLLDHDWDSVEKVKGFLWDAALVNTGSLYLDGVVEASDYSETNRQIVDKQGFHALMIGIAVPSDSSIAEAHRMGRIRDVSTGGLTHNKLLCPNCTAQYGENVEIFGDARCECIPMVEGWEEYAKRGARIAPYIIKSGFHSYTELTACVEGQLPGAGLLENG